MNALILTGRVLPGADEQRVWTEVAALFKLEPETFKTRVLARCPVSIRETADIAEARRSHAGLQKCGAEAELVESDESKWSLQQNGRVSGPVPLPFLKHEHEAFRLPDEILVKPVGKSEWMTLAEAVGKGAPIFKLDIPPDLDDDPSSLGSIPLSNAASSSGTPPPLPSKRPTKPPSSYAPTAGEKQAGNTAETSHANATVPPDPKSIPLAIALNFLLPGAGYFYINKPLQGVLALLIVLAMVFFVGFLVPTWIGLNVLMAVDMWLLGTKQNASSLAGQKMRCPHCAEVIQREAKLCRFCGNTVATPQTP